jgi:hypothetical protein
MTGGGEVKLPGTVASRHPQVNQSALFGHETGAPYYEAEIDAIDPRTEEKLKRRGPNSRGCEEQPNMTIPKRP